MPEAYSLEEEMGHAQKGDKTAYSRVLNAIVPRLYAYVRKKLNRTQDVEDVVQEILMSIHKASHTYDANRSFTSWMYAIASHRVNDFLRSHYRKGDERMGVNYDDFAYGMADTSDVTNSYETNEYISKALDKLPENQKKIVSMMKIEGYSVAETANEMNMSESAVKVSAHRAMKFLSSRAKV